MPFPGDAKSSSTSVSLLRRVQAFDPQAWERLTQLYGPLVYRWARRAGLDSTDAADVVQEVFQAVAKNIGRFHRKQPGDSFRGWLWTITRNKIQDHFRTETKQTRAVGGDNHWERMRRLPEASPDESGHEARQEIAGVYTRALRLIEASFPPQQWRIFVRVAVEGQAPAAVAEDLGISVWSVYQVKSRVLRRLRQELADLIEPPEELRE